MFRVNPESWATESISEVDFASLGLQERRDIQEWIAANPGILGDDLLIIGKEFNGFDLTNERLDLLAVDRDGKLVIIELKRDDTGADAHWQAIKYASYPHHATANQIIEMMAEHHSISVENAVVRLQQHLGADDLNALNNDQRIILASHRFAPQVTSAALWLNEKAPGESLITCIQLIPYHDPISNSLYIQASTIIPVPGIDNYIIRLDDNLQKATPTSTSNFAANLQRAFDRNANDEVTPFLRRVGDSAINGLSTEIRPDKISRWGAGWPDWRYYHFWNARHPWSNWGTSYRINLYPQEESDEWRAEVEFRHDQNGLMTYLAGVSIHDDQNGDHGGISVTVGSDRLNDEFGDKIAATVRRFIEKITPVVNDFHDQGNEEAV